MSLYEGPAALSYSVVCPPGDGGGGKEPGADEFTAEFTAKLAGGRGIQEPSGGGSGDGFTRCRHIPAPQAGQFPRGSTLARIWLLTRGLFQTGEWPVPVHKLVLGVPPSHLPWVPRGERQREPSSRISTHSAQSHRATRPRLPHLV